MYGLRPAAKAWEEEYAAKLVKAGYKRGVAAPTVFHEGAGDVSLVVHGDDFTALGPDKELKKLEEKMNSWYNVKTRGKLGPERKFDKEISILNRKVCWGDKVITYEAVGRNIENVIKAVGLSEKSKGLDVPMTVETMGESVEEDAELEGKEATRFRSVAALANYIAMDGPRGGECPVQGHGQAHGGKLE